jgi:hypothetical protein
MTASSVAQSFCTSARSTDPARQATVPADFMAQLLALSVRESSIVVGVTEHDFEAVNTAVVLMSKQTSSIVIGHFSTA